MLAIGCPRWSIVARDLPPEAPSAVFFANRVTSASVEALAFGIRRGMRRREAQARCPELEVIDHDPATDARAFEQVVAAVEAFSPRVEIVRPGLCITPARGPARYFGGEQALRAKLAEAVDETIEARRMHPLHVDDRSRIGIADGAFAATMAAVRGRIVEPGDSPSFLAGFGVEVLEDGLSTGRSSGGSGLADLLRRLGVATLGALAALPVDKVVARFGADGAIAHRLASGTDDRLFEPREIPPELTVDRELDPPAHRVDAASFVGKAAADELMDRLGTLGLACARIAIGAVTEHGEERTRTWRYSAAFTSAAIAERVRWQLDGWLHDEVLTGGIAKLRLEPLDVGPATGAQAKLWGRRAPDAASSGPIQEVSDAVRRAVARVQGLLGPEGAQQARLSGGRHPSEQVSSAPWSEALEAEHPGLPGAVTVQGPVTVELPPWPGRLPPPAPALVLERPRPVEVVDAAGQPVGVTGRGIVGAEPARMRLDGWHDVVAWSGPWPVDERWWDPDAHHRRARFQVVLADGSAHLLSLTSGEWHLEATYD